ncbi:hypothetical protein [Spirosoma fluviale]|uniref:Uncharacterized protein n=1 Tax=Spirosoma fluviale TaxID=1597977 RepID=A0A286G2F3_9BACT|nr:hypothetical protein [Spirosoma fluviale]SOD89701.1 hypothetical protein SAMN06269250_3161 [Spirosoma fluviale]
MSYLNSPRLTFNGDFQSDVSTVNNDTAHYNNETFKPSFQIPSDSNDPNGWWNPEGGAVFNFLNCKVSQLTFEDGTVKSDPGSDMILGQFVGGPEGRPTGKMVDLDPDQQGVSALWCVQLRLFTASNELLFQGDIATTAFRDLQFRQTDGGKTNGQPLGGTWTSVMTNVQWGEKALASSPFLQKLKEVTHENKLSINLNAFGYHYNHSQDGRFSLGRILGSIGPWFKGEPDTFLPGRRLYGLVGLRGPAYFRISNFITEPETKRLTVDFGSSFPIADALGCISLTTPLLLGVAKIPVNQGPAQEATYITPTDFLKIGPVEYKTGSADWLNQTGGIVSFSNLPDLTFSSLTHNQLLLVSPSASTPGQLAIIARESVEGLYVRADNFVQRLDTDDESTIAFYAYRWGKPFANSAINVTLDSPTADTPLGPNNPISIVYGNNYPSDGLKFASGIFTDQQGLACLKILGKAIHSPRKYIDGQVYTLQYTLETYPNDYNDFAMMRDIIAVHLRDQFDVPEPPTWEAIKSTLIQYSNLYPIMSKYLVNLSDPVDLKLKKARLLFAFKQPITNTMHMPVTRDLSKAKREAIIKWLEYGELPEANDPTNENPPVPISQNPLGAGTPLTESQQDYRNVIKAKNGSMPSFPVIQNLFENL